MFIKYGTYLHANNECAVIVSKSPRFNEGGQQVSVIEHWDITGFIQAASQAALTSALAALATAYATNGQDLTLLLDDGVTPTHHRIVNANTLGGVRVVQGPNFPQGVGAEYSTFRSYSISLEAEIPVSGATSLLIFFEEMLSFKGGGQRFVHLQTLTGSPQKQIVAASTPYMATQSGRSVGYGGYPAVPSPLWPSSEQRDQRDVAYKSPKRSGPVGSPNYSEYEVSWSYHFEDAAALSGTPNVWS